MKQTTLTPSQTLLCKLGSIVVHTEEMLSPDGREFDRVSIQILLQEPDVQKWIKEMGVLLPLKRVR